MTEFIKMHGCGNDFIVLDGRCQAVPVLDWVRLADRRFGIGCDQIVILQASDKADILMRIINADGSEVAACGNASRCVGWMVAKENKKKIVLIETFAGILRASIEGEQVTVDMGRPRLAWHEIPLAEPMDTLYMPSIEGIREQPACVSMGNPHVVFFVPDADEVPLDRIGPVIERHELFPERVNVGIAQVTSVNAIKLRVWERGGAMPLSCGTGACAAVVAGHLRGLLQGAVEVTSAGGRLLIKLDRQSGHVFMTGTVNVSYEGSFDHADFAIR